MSKEKNFTRFSKSKLVGKDRSVIPYLYAIGGSKSSITRTPVLAAGFQLEGNLCHFDKLHYITQLEISHAPLEIKRAKYAKALLAGTSVVLVKAV